MEPNKRVDPRRVCTLLLARLLPETKKAPTRDKVVAAISSLLEGASSSESPRDAATQAWETCVQSGWIDARPARLTEAGRKQLRTLLEIQELPKPKKWSEVQPLLLRAALGAPQASAGEPAAQILCATHGLPASPTLTAAVDRLAWRALGVETDAPFLASSVQRHVLRDLVPADARLKPEAFRKLLVMRSVGATQGDAGSLRSALTKRWLQGKEASATASASQERGVVVTANDNSNRGETSLESFAAAVMETARGPGVARFHDDRAFIGSIWEHMHGRAPVFAMPLAEFKEKLVTAHRQRLLRMSRADLVQAMDPAEVERSEARYMNATFHFVALPAGASQ